MKDGDNYLDVYTWQEKSHIDWSQLKDLGFSSALLFPSTFSGFDYSHCYSDHTQWSKNKNSFLRTKMLFMKLWISTFHEKEVIAPFQYAASLQSHPSFLSPSSLSLGHFWKLFRPECSYCWLTHTWSQRIPVLWGEERKELLVKGKRNPPSAQQGLDSCKGRDACCNSWCVIRLWLEPCSSRS